MAIAPTTTQQSTASPAAQIALAAIRAGISVVPIRADGSKQPALSGWKIYQQRLPSSSELACWFRAAGLGLALVTGAVSGHLEALDFDDGTVFEQWQAWIAGDPMLSDLYASIASGYEEVTPAGGRHLLYRCSEVAGNQKLASRQEDGRTKTLIETRGQGGLIIVDPSQGKVHPSGRPYRRVQGSVSTIRTITPDEREQLFWSARQFDERPKPQPAPLPRSFRCSFPRLGELGDSVRPGDLLNERATWEELLPPYGWELVRYVGEEGQWRRPGKEGEGISATTNYQNSGFLYVFSTSTMFEPERGYSKFSAYALLEHGGDFSAAAKALAEQGYVDSEPVARLW